MGCILLSCVIRIIDWQLYSRSLMNCSAKEIHLTPETWAGSGKWLLQSCGFCNFIWSLSESVFKNNKQAETGQTRLSCRRLVKMLLRLHHLIFKTKPGMLSLEHSSILKKTKCLNRTWGWTLKPNRSCRLGTHFWQIINCCGKLWNWLILPSYPSRIPSWTML